MKILFYLDYKTTFGEQLVLNLMGQDGVSQKLTMATNDGQLWYGELLIDAVGALHYY